MRSLFAGVKESRSTTLATYIKHNDAVRLTLACAIGKRAEQWPIKTPSCASVIARTCTCKSRKRERWKRTRMQSRKKRYFSSSLHFARDISKMKHVLKFNWESSSLNSSEENVIITSIYALHCIALCCVALRCVASRCVALHARKFRLLVRVFIFVGHEWHIKKSSVNNSVK